MQRFLSALAGLAIIVLIASCSGGGGGDGSGPSGFNAPPAASGPASVSVLLTDASSDDYDAAIATITCVKLIGENGQQEIFSGSATVDLLKLRDFVELVTVNENVEPDVISKIRLCLSSLILVKYDNDGEIEKEDIVDLVANGKMDLLLAEKVAILPGEKYYISFDFDMDKSLKIIETGNGKIKVRPVIFVHVGRLPGFKEGLTRIFGEVTRLAEAEDFPVLQICSSRLMATPFGMDDEVDLPERCVKVVLDGRTGVFSPDGLPLRADTGCLLYDTDRCLMIGDLVTIVGFLGLEDEDGEGPTPKLFSLDDSTLMKKDHDSDSHADSDSDSDSDSDGGDRPPVPDLDFVLRAIVIENGPMGTFARLRGELLSEVGMDDQYKFLVGPQQGFGPDTMMLGQLYPTSRIFKFDGTEIRRQELMAGDGALVDGVVILSGPSEPMEPEPVAGEEAEDANVLRSAFMLVRADGGTEPPEPEEETLVGKILSIDRVQMMVSTATMGDRCVLAVDALVLFLIENDSGGLDVIKGGYSDLGAGMAIVAFGVENVGGCFDADFIVTQGPMKPSTDPL
jgi:hypothetical protein